MLNAILSIPCLRCFGKRERRVHFDLFALVRLFCAHVAFHRLAKMPNRLKCKQAQSSQMNNEQWKKNNSTAYVICFNQKSNIGIQNKLPRCGWCTGKCCQKRKNTHTHQAKGLAVKITNCCLKTERKRSTASTTGLIYSNKFENVR